MSGLVIRTIGTFGNILWLVLAGWWIALAYLTTGLGWCLTIVGIPFGVQAFKLARFSLWPFGKEVVERPGGTGPLGAIGNILWVIFTGFWLAVAHVIAGALLCLTIVGIPLGMACFKLVPLAFWPFGRRIVDANEAFLYQQ